MDAIAREWKDKLMETISPVAHLPLLLSGGVDSATLLAAQMELGYKPRCYSFRLGNRDSTDVSVARKICADYSLPLTVISIPREEGVLIADIKYLIDILGTNKKAAIQCSQPVMYMARAIKVDGYNGAIVGTGAVVLDDKRVAILWAKQGEEAARKYRAAKLDDRHLPVGTGYMHRIAKLHGVLLEEPYSDEPLRSHALALDYAELNKPKQKGIALRAFPDFYNKGYWRRNSPLQVNSGIREWHDTLVKSSYNKRNCKSVVCIYNDFYREIHGDEKLAKV